MRNCNKERVLTCTPYHVFIEIKIMLIKALVSFSHILTSYLIFHGVKNEWRKSSKFKKRSLKVTQYVFSNTKFILNPFLATINFHLFPFFNFS